MEATTIGIDSGMYSVRWKIERSVQQSIRTNPGFCGKLRLTIGKDRRIIIRWKMGEVRPSLFERPRRAVSRKP